MKALAAIFGVIFWFILVTSLWGMDTLSKAVFFVATLLLLQGMFATVAMLYTWMKQRNLDKVKPPKLLYGKPTRTFSLIIPARHEKEVVGDTLRSMARIKYPQEKYEVLVAVRHDDEETIAEVRRTIKELADTGANIRLVIFDGYPINKAHGLNVGLHYAQNEIVGVFDAEDESHPDILSTVDTVFSHKGVDVVQSAIQLINVSSKWFSALNSLEYYFWFKSVLPMFSQMGSTPLGGNTVFFRHSVLAKIEGWDEKMLTEDADIGLRLSSLGYKITTVYDERLATLEETPGDLKSFIRQRTRWDQGYLQVLFKGEWMRLPTFSQQLITLYLLLQPLIHHFGILGFVFLPAFVAGTGVPLWLAFYSFLPMYFFFLQIGISMVGLNDLSRRYNIGVSRSLYIGMAVSYISYQLVLSFASFRAFIRMFLNIFVWEKTTHLNLHRIALAKLKRQNDANKDR